MTTPTFDIEATRPDFEKAMREKRDADDPYINHDLDRWPTLPDQYISVATQCEWQGWKAAMEFMVKGG